MQLAIRHTTTYSFSQAASHGLQRLRLRPKSTHGQQVIDWKMELAGAKCEAEYEDQHNNQTALVSIEPGTRQLIIACSGLVTTSDNAGIIGPHTGHMPLWHFLGQTELTRPGVKMRALVTKLEPEGEGPLPLLHALSSGVLAAVQYEIGHTDAKTTAETAMAEGRGVCQDHAHIFIGAARLLGIPARYVSGYLMMDDRIDQEAGHGWAEAHVAGLGWVAFDVSNGISADARYVRAATGCDYREAAPVTGISYGDGDSALAVSLAVEQQLVEQ
ncbi:MAG: transglutaminase family protein [Novosphingobium sp.]